ncbi:hypothetical protein [Micromonospora sp. DT47]|uniref:hypothetical protein n=1 Tax=Micromonospora sp. DT47 TaxID=3393431 RepID=UPI003CEEF665
MSHAHTAPAGWQRHIAEDLAVTAGFGPAVEADRRAQFLVDQLITAGHRALVLGISGGIDSASAGRLCQLVAEQARHTGRHATFVAMRLEHLRRPDPRERHAEGATASTRDSTSTTIKAGPGASP